MILLQNFISYFLYMKKEKTRNKIREGLTTIKNFLNKNNFYQLCNFSLRKYSRTFIQVADTSTLKQMFIRIEEISKKKIRYISLDYIMCQSVGTCDL